MYTNCKILRLLK